jgi:hypothetical protein
VLDVGAFMVSSEVEEGRGMVSDLVDTSAEVGCEPEDACHAFQSGQRFDQTPAGEQMALSDGRGMGTRSCPLTLANGEWPPSMGKSE